MKFCIYSSKLIYKLELINQTSSSAINISDVSNAINIAKEYHKDQIRKSGEPYYAHPLRVASLVSNHSSDTNLIVAAILHDTIEDTDLTLEELKTLIPQYPADLVGNLTRGDKKVKYYSALESLNMLIATNNQDAMLIKICDRLDNIESIYPLSIEKQIRILEESIYFLPAVKLIDQLGLGWKLYCSIIETKIRLGIIPADFGPLNNLRESFDRVISLEVV